MTGIYKITNKENGKVYIGQATNIEKRLSEHRRKRTQTIDNYINILGVDSFDFEIIEECTPEQLNEREKYYIQKYDSQLRGYNIQDGGLNNSVGEGNGRAKLSEEIVIKMREAYANHESPLDFYNSIRYTGISKSSFQCAWQGRSWGHVMPEVFTEENRQYYIHEMQRERLSLFTEEEVIRYRTYYISHTATEVYYLIQQEKGEDFVSLGTVKKMLCGDGKQNNFYQNIPIYSKKLGKWILNGEPVTTISESGE